MNRFRKMGAAEFAAYRPRNEAEAEAHEKESRYRDWCGERGLEPESDEAREGFAEEEAEQGDAAWDAMNDDDRIGYEDNMNKD